MRIFTVEFRIEDANDIYTVEDIESIIESISDVIVNNIAVEQVEA